MLCLAVLRKDRKLDDVSYFKFYERRRRELGTKKNVNKGSLSGRDGIFYAEKDIFFFNVDSEIERNIGRKREENSTSFSLVNFRLILKYRFDIMSM